MNTKNADSKAIKTIVPIKGNLLAKIRNKLKNNGSTVTNAETSDLINNNSQIEETSKANDETEMQIKPPKVIIQKVEKVNLEIENLFVDHSSSQEQSSSSSSTTTLQNENIIQVDVTPEEKKVEDTAVKLLHAKMPANDFNKEVPLKMVRTVRKPKVVPNIPRRRYGHVAVQVKVDEKPDNTVATVTEPLPQTSTQDEVIQNTVEIPTVGNNAENKKKENHCETIKPEEDIVMPESPAAKEDKEEDLMDTNEATWLNDISVMIGESRIKEIDKGLKKIPAVVTGNKIQTENVELKLIINHLLSKLKAESVTQTLDQPSMSSLNLNDSYKFDFSDTFDSMTEDDFSKDSSFFNESLGIQNTSSSLTKLVKEEQETQKNQVEVNPIKAKTENLAATRKRRGRSPQPKSTSKRAKKAPILEKSCDSDAANLLQLPSRESSLESPKVHATRHANRIRNSSRESSMEKLLVPKPFVIMERTRLRSSSQEKFSAAVKSSSPKDSSNKKKKVTRVQELRDSEVESYTNKRSESSSSSSGCETEGLIKKRGRKKKQIAPETDVSPSVMAPIKKSSRIAQKSTTTVNSPASETMVKKKNFTKRNSSRKNILSTSDSESETLSTPTVLKSHSTPKDFNSKNRSSILERNDYLKKSSSIDKSKNELTDHPVFAELGERLTKIKESDPSYTLQNTNQKRPYLKTSAFIRGNNFDLSDTTDSNTQDGPSVSHDSTNNHITNGDLKCIMKHLIDKEKLKIQTPKTSQNSLAKKESTPLRSSKKGRPSQRISKKDANGEVSIKTFDQKELRNSIEKEVLYNEIMEAIRVSDPAYSKMRKFMDESKQQKMECELRSLAHFRCGSCGNLVTKHQWKEHIEEHGGIAWLDKFEISININEWNETVRRLINIMRIYHLEILRCPNCQLEKRSAIGHLTHVYICAQDEETIEKRKIKCQTCDERIFPYSMSAHRKTCRGLEQEAEECKAKSESDEDDDASSLNSSVKSGGRLKRKAVKKAEKKLKTIVIKLQKDAAEEEESDFDHSSTDASIHDNESSETEGSSGVESSDVDTEDEDGIENDDSLNISFRQGKPTVADTDEIKAARQLVAPYIESFQGLKISSKTIKWTREFINDNLSENILTKLAPKYKTLAIKLSSFLQNAQLKSTSMKFYTDITDNYYSDYQNCTLNNDEWQELEVGEEHGNKQSLTLFCGGSVSALDWAQTTIRQDNFLAISCNSFDSAQSNMTLEHTSKSCIQVYKLQHLENDKFSNFEDISTLLYMFTINDGPIWSIKFHPFVIASDERIGLLAVTTANQSVYIFSLPYLNANDDDNESNRNLVISLEPSIICKLSEAPIFNQDKFLMQVSTVNWYYRKDQTQLLAAGYVNGYIAIWKIDDDDDDQINSNQPQSLLPYLVFQPHFETITSIDFKNFEDLQILMLTTSMDRGLKVHVIENDQFREVESQYAMSRNTCAEWCYNWPGFLYGNDNCFSLSGLCYRQPVDFATRNLALLQSLSAVCDLSINHWLNYAVFICDSGDVLGSNPHQLIHSYPKDRWQFFGNTVLTYTDVVKLNDSDDAYGIVFSDIKSKLSKRPKSFRTVPTELSLKLQINSIRFNRNEMSHRFYAIGYETGFVRIKHLKNFK